MQRRNAAAGNARNEPRSSQGQRVVPSLAVEAEDDTGITISGIKMLATSAAFCDEIWIGNIVPLAAGHESKSITCVVRPNAPGGVCGRASPTSAMR
jgi:4-hydroxyphenylacetate 3-monooxygenase